MKAGERTYRASGEAGHDRQLEPDRHVFDSEQVDDSGDEEGGDYPGDDQRKEIEDEKGDRDPPELELEREESDADHQESDFFKLLAESLEDQLEGLSGVGVQVLQPVARKDQPADQDSDDSRHVQALISGPRRKGS